MHSARRSLSTMRRPIATATTALARSPTLLSKRGFSQAATSHGIPLLPSQILIVFPQLAPRMTRGSVLEWKVREGQEIKPTQVLLHVRTNELTEDGSERVLEIESHESGILRKILEPVTIVPPPSSSSSAAPSAAATAAAAAEPHLRLLDVATPIAIFEDPDWSPADKPRGEFLWQAYVKEPIRSGSCSPVREEDSSEPVTPAPAAPTSPPASDAKKKRVSKKKTPS